MTTRIPNLYKTHLVVVSFCSFVADKDKKQAQVLAKVPVEIDCEASTGKSKHRVSLGASVDSDKDVHVHVDLARLDLLDKGALPPKQNTLSDWNSTLDKLHGLSIRLRVVGNYRIPWKSVPEEGLIQSLSDLSAEAGGLTMSLKGADFEIGGGGPCTNLTWSKRGEFIRGEIFARFETVLSDSYLEDAVKVLDQGIRRLVLEEKVDNEK